MFEVKLRDGRMIRRHADQMRSRAPADVVTKESNGNTDEGDDFDIIGFPIPRKTLEPLPLTHNRNS